MIGAFIVCTLLVLASAQILPNLEGRERDRHAGHTFELLSKGHVMLIRNVYYCYLIHTNDNLEKRFLDKATRASLEDDLLQQIQNHKDMYLKTEGEALGEFKDIAVDIECRHRTLYELSYKP